MYKRQLPDLAQVRRSDLLGDVLERERIASTGLGHGVALPHPRKPRPDLFRDPVLSVLFPVRPLDWAAVDRVAVFAVLLLVSPSPNVHLQMLPRIAYVLRSPEFREFLRGDPLRGHPSKEELVERLRSIPLQGAP